MEAVEYFETKRRMTKAKSGKCSILCPDCRLYHENNGTGCTCQAFEGMYPEKAVEIVKQWAKEHPQKTYAMDFFKKFPDAPRRDDGSPKACRCVVYSNNHCKHNGCEVCWNEPMEEDQQ